MKFWEAIRSMQEGSRVRCVTWPAVNEKKSDIGNAVGLFYIDGNMSWVCFTKKDRESEWELYEEPEQLKCSHCGNADCGTVQRMKESRDEIEPFEIERLRRRIDGVERDIVALIDKDQIWLSLFTKVGEKLTEFKQLMDVSKN